MDNNKLKKNYIYNLSYQIFAIIVPLVTTPYISRILSPGGIGKYSFTYAIVKYFILVAILGSSSFGIREIGKCIEDKKERSKVFWNIFSFRFISTLLMIILYLIYVLLFASNKTIALVQTIYLVGLLFDISWFYQGIEDIKRITIRNFFIKLLNIVFIFMFIKEEKDLLLYVFGLASFSFLGIISMWYKVGKHLNKPNIRDIKPYKNIKEMLELFIPTIAVTIFSLIDKTMIGLFSSSSVENGYYEQSLKIVDMSLTIVTSLSSIMIPSIAREYHKKNYDSVNNKMEKSYRFVFLLAIPMTMGLIGITNKFVPLFFGNEYDKVKVILPILSLLYIPMCINNITGTQYLIATGKQNKYSKFLLIGGLSNIIFNFILIPIYYSIGAAIGSLFGELVSMSLCILYLERNHLLNFKIFRLSNKYLLSGTIMLIFLILLNLVRLNNLCFCIIGIIGSMAIYSILLLIMKEPIITDIIKNILRRVKKSHS